MTGYADLEISQNEDYAVQFIWTDKNNEPYQVCHPIRMQARAATGQTIIDATSVDQTVEQAAGTEPRILYSTEGGVIQLVLPADVTVNLPSGETIFYDLFASYYSTANNFVTEEEEVTVRKKKVLMGKIKIEGRVTKNV